jgi:hypothetical protein
MQRLVGNTYWQPKLEVDVLALGLSHSYSALIVRGELDGTVATCPFMETCSRSIREGPQDLR